MRIIAGKFKGRKLIDSSHLKDLRPTTDKNREALFNILNSAKFIKEINFTLENISVLDICCGSGAIAFEALSRGAKSVFLIDKNNKHLEIAKENAKILQLTDEVKFLLADAINLQKSAVQYDMVYIDPPYSINPKEIVKSICKNNFVTQNSLIIIETKERNFVDWEVEILECREYKRINFVFAKCKAVLQNI